MARIYDDAAVNFGQPFDQDSNVPTIDAGVDTTGLNYDPKTGTFSFNGQGGGGAGGGAPLPSRNPMPPGVGPNTSAMGSQGVSAGIGAASGAGGGLLNALGNGAASAAGGLDWKDILALIMGGGAALGGALQGPPQAESELNEILKIAKGRIGAQEPLFKAFTTMAHGQLPRWTRGE